MTNDVSVELLQRADVAIGEDDDHMVAEGQSLAWLIAQLACWPVRVDPESTTNDRFLRLSAAATLRRLSRPSPAPSEDVVERSGWYPIDLLPDNGAGHREHGLSMLLHAPELVHADFNPFGIAEGHWQDGGLEGDRDPGAFLAPVWCGCHDEWEMREVSPTHFMIVTPPVDSAAVSDDASNYVRESWRGVPLPHSPSVEALKPFAEIAQQADDFDPELSDGLLIGNTDWHDTITLGDCRRAREALARLSPLPLVGEDR